MKQRHITERIICSFYNVYNKLGYGFLEKVYEVLPQNLWVALRAVAAERRPGG